MDNLTTYLKKEIVTDKFCDVLGARDAALPFIQSVLLVVAGSTDLQKCTHESIISAALETATLSLSVTPNRKQAYLVPYTHYKTHRLEAKLVVGYKGWYDMAWRTGWYRDIDAYPISQGFRVVEELAGEDGVIGRPVARLVKDTNSPGGYMARYELTEAMGGKQKVVFMDHTQLKAHRDKYAKGLQREGSVWNSSYDVACMKTVVKRLLTWHGYFEDVNTELISRLRFNDQSVELEELPAQVTEESEVLVGHILSADEHLPLNIQHETPLPVEWRK